MSDKHIREAIRLAKKLGGHAEVRDNSRNHRIIDLWSRDGKRQGSVFAACSPRDQSTAIKILCREVRQFMNGEKP